MNILSWLTGGVIQAVGDTAKQFITTEKDKLEYQLKFRQQDLEELKAQLGIIEKIHETNIEEAKSTNLFIAGWRPFIGWICGFALGYHFIFAPLLTSLLNIPLPNLDYTYLNDILIALLGLGTLRTFEKIKKAEGNR